MSVEALASTVLSLLGVCAAAVVLLRVLGRRQRQANGGLRLVAELPLESRRSLYLVEVCGRFLVVGAGDGAVALLTEIERDKALAVTNASNDGTAPQLLARFFSRGRG